MDVKRYVLPVVGFVVIAVLAAGALGGRRGGGAGKEGAGGPQARPPVPAEGQLLPDFELETLDGGRVRARDLLGKPTFINFWASWCPPCRAEMPDIQAIYERQGGELNILAINEDEPPGVVRSFVDEVGFTVPVALDVGGELHARWNFNTLPTSIITDKDGRVCFIAPGMITRDTMDAVLDKARRGC